MSDRVRLVHWNDVEAAACAARLVSAGYGVDARPLDKKGFAALRADPPAACVIDLSRLPSHGREVATGLRGAKATRHIPIVFVAGEAGAVERVRTAVPDATFTTWSRIRSALKRALGPPARVTRRSRALPIVP